VNGNRKDAVEEILEMPRAKAVMAAIELFALLDTENKKVLKVLLENRVKD
jgi:hypothetical protein